MSRLIITLRDPLALRLAAAANTTGLHPEDLARCAVSSLVGHIEREGGLPVPTALHASTEPPASSDTREVAP